LAAAGFEFIEVNVQGHLKTLEEEAAFLDELARIRAAPLPAIAANSFVPGSLKITGPDVDWDALEAYVRRAFGRAQAAGVRTIVFGSGGARRIPDGFDRGEAWAQLIRFGRLMGPIAQAHQVTVVAEPLNTTRGECNVLTTVAETAGYVIEVGHPNVQLLVDAYHWGLDGDSFDDIVSYGHLIGHVHIATTTNRKPPGQEPCDFSRFFQALGLAGYDGAISIEAGWDDLAQQASEAFDALAELVTSAGL
jgi:sugar phosphate isomerase/epimerase